jgi:exodeoxyribonuclease-3
VDSALVRIISFNANGIRSAARKGFFAWMLAESPDFVCIQETKAQEHQLPGEAVLAGYSAVYLDAAKKGYSGVAIYSRTTPQTVTRGLGEGLLDDEARFLRFDYARFSICSLYVPSGTSGPARQEVKYAFLERLLVEFARMRAEGRPIVICGDYNIAHLDIDVFNVRACTATTGFLPPERAWFDRVIDAVGWVDAFRVVNQERKQFTWWSSWRNAFANNLGWRIDYQLVTPELRPHVQGARIYKDERFSDHAPLIVDYSELTA